MTPPPDDPETVQFSPAGGDGPRDAAAVLFVDYLAQRGRDSTVDFEEFCRSNADKEDDLRRLHAEWTQADGVLRRLGMSGSVTRAAVAATRTHAQIDRVDTAVLSEVLERLATRQRPIERYDIHGEIAAGGMGSIQRVWDQDLRRNLAMKVVLQRGLAERRESPAQQRALGRFIEEAQVTGQLDHPGIVPVHELGIDDEGRAYFTMQLVRGRDLEALFEVVHQHTEEDWTLTRAVNVLLRVSDAMAYAHAKGVIHRDLKPANVMSGRFGEVYVMDWGLARVMGEEDSHDLRLAKLPDPSLSIEIHTDRSDARDSQDSSPLATLDGDIVGTPAYMSPEQARGDLEAMGPASDIYSLGAMLYHLLSGTMPYQRPGEQVNAIATWTKLQAGPPTPLDQAAPDAPAELIAICEKAMAREPSARYRDMSAFGRDLRAFLEGRVVGAVETGAVAEFKKWVARNKALATTSMAAGLIVIAGLSLASAVLANKNEQLTQSEARARDNELLAIDREQEARTNARIARDRADTILRLADAKRFEQLTERAESLWPAFPSMIESYETWLREADELVGRLDLHERELRRLRAGASTSSGGPLKFKNTEVEWLHDALADLVVDLQGLRAEGGLLEEIRGRLERARTIGERSVDGDDARARWQRAIKSIASTSECPMYEGLELAPQLGLLPIGRDARSGLWEFVDLQTGDKPGRDPITGELVPSEGSGLVFVLIPGGRTWIGSQHSDTSMPNYMFQAPPDEGPAHRVELSPFLLSKYEMTQAQWERFTGANPSFYLPGESFAGHVHDLLFPVEQISWFEAVQVLGRLGMQLPTEAQWEHAARGGTTGPWSSGLAPESLEGYANIGDESAARFGAPWPDVAGGTLFDDGWVATARVGSFEPNPFGLHDVHGNVYEWCADLYETSYDLTLERPGDGLRKPDELPEDPVRVNRGGSFKHSAENVRSARRNQSAPGLINDVLGVRPARMLTD